MEYPECVPILEFFVKDEVYPPVSDRLVVGNASQNEFHVVIFPFKVSSKFKLRNF